MNKLLRFFLFGFFATCVALVSKSEAWAHGAGGDIALFATEGQADVGFAILDDDDDVQEFFDPDENVFSSVLLPVGTNPQVPWDFGSPEPGLDADEGALPENAGITVNLLDLSYWDGSGGVSFSPFTLDGGFAPDMMQSAPDGGFHSHPYFGVGDPEGVAPNGVYVGKLSISVEGLTDSKPFYMVSLVTDSINSIADIDERTDAAESLGEMVRHYLEDPAGHETPVFNGTDFSFFADAVAEVRVLAIPEPSSLLSALIAVGVLARRRRWRNR